MTPEPSLTAPGTWRAPADAPAWAAGKTPEELLGIVIPAMEQLDKFNQSGKVLSQTYTPPPPAQNQGQQWNGAPVPGQPKTYDPNDYPTWGELQAFQQQQAQQHLAPQFQGMYESQAAQSLQLLRLQTPNQKAFDKYGPEINAEIAKLPAHVRTIDNLQMVVDLVRGRHVEELARDIAATLSTQPPTMRPNGYAGSTGSPPIDNGLSLHSDKIPEAWKQRAIQQGLTDEGIAEFCRANNMPVQDFYKMLEKSKVVTDSNIVTAKFNSEGKALGTEVIIGR